MLPDDKLGMDGFHDVIIENLSATPTCGHYMFRQRTGLRCRASDIERLRRDAPKRADKAFRYSVPGFCGVCDTRIYSALDGHMIAYHLELGQLWRCPVTWCAVWEGIGTCLFGTSGGKAWGIDAGGHDKRCQVFSAMDGDSVSRVAVDVLLFYEAGRRLVHRYRVYKDPFPHPALRDGVIPRLLSYVGSGHGHRPAHSSANFDLVDWGSPGSGAAGVFSGDDGPSPRYGL